MKLLALIFWTSCLFISCKGSLKTKIICQDFQEITVINKNADKNMPDRIVINDSITIEKFCKSLKNSIELNSPNVKDHYGYYEFIIKLKNGKNMRIDIIRTHYEGIVMRYGMKYYKSDIIEDFIENYL